MTEASHRKTVGLEGSKPLSKIAVNPPAISPPPVALMVVKTFAA